MPRAKFARHQTMDMMELMEYEQMAYDNPRARPDIVTFVTSPAFLDRPYLYPRQATLLRIIFLELDHLTDYDYAVIDQWKAGFRMPSQATSGFDLEAEATMRWEGDWGIVPDIEARMEYLEANGYPWFSLVLGVLGRRSGKGYLGALCTAYVLWCYLTLGDGNPRDHFGIDKAKRMACQVFAGKKMQARDNQWRDIVNVITGSYCFQPYISQSLGESLTLWTPQDKKDGVHLKTDTTMDLATFEIVPKEATTMAARGPASFAQLYDEMAHMTGTTGGSRSAKEVYDAATPSLDQFKKYQFIYAGSSPWAMSGQYYELCQQTLQVDADTHKPVYPENLLIQLESWDMYTDWEKTKETFVLGHAYEASTRHEDQPVEVKEVQAVEIKVAIQEYDDRMRRLERANPDTFRVERRCLDPDTKVLKTNLTWCRIDDLEEGDSLIGFDEEAPDSSHKVGHLNRCLRTTTVIKKWDNTDEAYRVSFDDGSSVICSGNHRWFSTSAGSPNSYRWRSLFRPPGGRGPAAVMRVGDRIAHLVDPWEVDRSWEAGYLAGVYDGEGTAIGYPRREFRVSFVQNPGEVLDATLEYLKLKGFDPRFMPYHSDRSKDRKAHVYVIQGLANCMRFVGQMGGHKMARQAIPGMWEGRGLGRVNGLAPFKTITAIEPVGQRRLVDIETTTGTFIAEGLISHNSKWATAMDAYFPEQHVRRMFAPWPDDERPGMQLRGDPTISYVMHGDPGKTGSNFGFAIAHKVSVPGQHIPHVVFDFVKGWMPGDFPNEYSEPDFPDHEMDYSAIEKEIMDLMDAFYPTDVSLDPWNSIGMLQRLASHARKTSFKTVNVWERTVTASVNWKTAETMKTALSLNLVHVPHNDLLEVECLFLRKLPGDKVDHPDTGPCTTKDVYDAVSICIHKLIGADVAAYMGEELSSLRAVASMPGPNSPESSLTVSKDEMVRNQFSQFSQDRRQQRNRNAMNAPRRRPR